MAAAAAANLRLRESKSHEKSIITLHLRLRESKSHEKSIIHCICVSEKINRTRKSDIILHLPRLLRLSKKMQQRPSA